MARLGLGTFPLESMDVDLTFEAFFMNQVLIRSEPSGLTVPIVVLATLVAPLITAP